MEGDMGGRKGNKEENESRIKVDGRNVEDMRARRA